MKEFESLKKVLEGKTRFLLVAHQDPDGDALGAILAFGQYLKDMGKEVRLASKDPVPGLFEFLIGTDNIAHDFLLGDFEAIVLMDNGDLRRTGFAERILRAKRHGKLLVNIDHHISNDIWKIADINVADPEYSSTSEIIFELLKFLKYDISADTATNLLTGIYYDTGGFIHSNTTNRVMNVSSELLLRGANLRKVSRSVNQTKSVPMLRLWGIALGRLKVLSSGLAYSFLSAEDIRVSSASEQDVSGLVGMINTTAEALASLLIYETEDGKIKGSLRTESDQIDVSRLAKSFGGGGHRRAAGFAIAGKFVKHQNCWRVE